MADVTVTQFAEVLKVPVERLLLLINHPWQARCRYGDQTNAFVGDRIDPVPLLRQSLITSRCPDRRSWATLGDFLQEVLA